jgi:hypothetical protein
MKFDDGRDEYIARGMRLLLARLTNDIDGYRLTLAEVDDCPVCLRNLIYVLSYYWLCTAVHERPQKDVIAGMEHSLAKHLDEMDRGV